MPDTMTTDVRTLLDREPFDSSAVLDLQEVLGRDPSRYVTLRDAAAAIADREPGKMKPETHLRLGIADCLLGRYRGALEHLGKAGDVGLAHYFRGIASENLQRWDDAIEAFGAASKGGYDAKRSELKRIGALRRGGRVDDARKLLDKMGDGATGLAEYHYQVGSMLAADGELQTAAGHFEKAIELDEGHTGALFELAYINDLYGNDDHAIGYYDRCTKRPPVPVAALINLGVLYEDDNRYREAEACYRKILNVIPAHPRARLFSKDVAASKEMYYDEDSERMSDQMRKLMEIPVTDFELSVRSRNCLKKMNIRTLGDLTRTTEAQLLASKNFGETSLTEIKEMMTSKALRLGMALESSEKVAQGFSQPPLEDASPEERAILQKPISELALSVRARKCMQKLNMQSVHQLIQRTGDELMECKNFGVTSLNEVREKLALLNLKLRGE